MRLSRRQLLAATAVSPFLSATDADACSCINTTNGVWMDHFAFGGNEFYLSFVGASEYCCDSGVGNVSSTGYNPFSVVNSVMSVTAKTVASSGISNPANQLWNSGCITSCTENCGEPTPGLYNTQFGYFEIRCQVPSGGTAGTPGSWPAFVLYPLAPITNNVVTGNAPPGEIDIFEILGGSTTVVRQSIHSSVVGANHEYDYTGAGDTSLAFHTYGCDVQSNFITFYVDNVQTAQQATPSDFITNQNNWYMNIPLEMAGSPSSWVGAPLVSVSTSTCVLQIDYVGVWLNHTAAYPSGGTTPAKAAALFLDDFNVINVNFFGSAPTNPIGPPASSPFLTADFKSPYFYPTPGTTTQNSSRGQMVISPRLWGVVDGAISNNSGQQGSFSDITNGNPYCLLTSPTYQQRMAVVNPGIWMPVTPPNGSGVPIWNEPYPASPGTPTLNANAFTNLINNFYKVDPLGVSGIILNINWQREANNPDSEAQFGRMMNVLATFFQNQVMPNGKRCPVIGFTGQNEPDNGQDLIGFYNQIVSNVKNVTLPGGGTYMVVGPVPNSVFLGTGNWASFSAGVSGMDVFQWDNFAPANSSNAFPMSYLQTPQSGGGIADWFDNGLQTQVANNVAYQPQAYAPVGNIGTVGTYSEQADYHSVMWEAIQRIRVANASPVQAWWMRWDSANQSNWGFLLDPGPAENDQISLGGYANGHGIRSTTGPRWNVTTNAAGLLCIACNPTSTDATMYIVNAGNGAQNGQTVAFSHWPINSTGNGTLNMYQITSSTPNNTTFAQGDPVTKTPVTFSGGVSQALNFPDPSLSIISSVPNF